MEAIDNFKNTKRSLKKNLLKLEEHLEKIEQIEDFSNLSKNLINARNQNNAISKEIK